MGSSKGLWSVISYPESSDIAKVIETLQGAGAECMYILHNRDKYDHDTETQLVKPHYHIACGWSKGYPDFKVLKDICSACGAVAPSPQKCKVHGTVQDLERYFLHKDDESRANPCKFEYDNIELQYTDNWSPSDYERAEDRRRRISRENKKTQEGVINDAIKIVRRENFCEWWELVDYYADKMPDKLADLCSTAFPIKSYMDSIRFSRKSGDIAEIKELKGKIADLEKDLSEKRTNNLCEQLAATRDELSSLAAAYDNEQGLLKTACIMLCSAYSDQGEFYSYVEMMRSIQFNYEKSIKNADFYDRAAEM